MSVAFDPKVALQRQEIVNERGRRAHREEGIPYTDEPALATCPSLLRVIRVGFGMSASYRLERILGTW